MSATPQEINGKLILIAHIYAAEGKGDEVAEIIKTLRDYSVSDAEPGTSVYRVTRFGDHFAHFEEYADAAAVEKHQSSPAFAKLLEALKAGTIAKVDLGHFKEF